MEKNNSDTPLITIGITCFNAQETIARAIHSALAQDWSNIEILVVDDASSDSSVTHIEELAKENPSIRLIVHDHNQGPAAARQSIVENAKGEFIAFFDDDDEALPQRCRVQYEKIISYEAQHKNVPVACYASGTRLYPNGYALELHAIGSQEKVPSGTDLANYVLFYGKTPGVFYGAGTPTCALMARTKTIKDIGGFDPAFRRVEDVDFAIRLSLAGGHFIGCAQSLFVQHSTQGNDKAPAKNLEAELQLVEKHKDYLKSVGMYEYARRTR